MSDGEERSIPISTGLQLQPRGAKVPGSNPGWSVIFSLTVICVVWWNSLGIISHYNLPTRLSPFPVQTIFPVFWFANALPVLLHLTAPRTYQLQTSVSFDDFLIFTYSGSSPFPFSASSRKPSSSFCKGAYSVVSLLLFTPFIVIAFSYDIGL